MAKRLLPIRGNTIGANLPATMPPTAPPAPAKAATSIDFRSIPVGFDPSDPMMSAVRSPVATCSACTPASTPTGSAAALPSMVTNCRGPMLLSRAAASAPPVAIARSILVRITAASARPSASTVSTAGAAAICPAGPAAAAPAINP
ncbi:hypothetical protein ACGF5S_07550 [Nocardia nova]|uniref:hypothetical protein n=1 Tax=Nocardia nova TaxID=37330 RepID=UPI0015E40EB0